MTRGDVDNEGDTDDADDKGDVDNEDSRCVHCIARAGEYLSLSVPPKLSSISGFW